MTFDPKQLADFARYYGFHYDICDPFTLMQDIRFEMDRGLKGESSSLPMLPSYLSPISHVPAGKTVIALDAGGTNMRAALVHFDENGKTIAEGTRKTHMPGTKGLVTAEKFFDEIAELIMPLLEKAKNLEGIGFCFSYPMEMTKDSDGILLGFSKEVDAPDVIGKAIGAGLREALAKRGAKVPERIVLLNDTVATLLSGLAEIPPNDRKHESEEVYKVENGPVIGFILGTGLNIAYPEKEIPKINFSSSQAQVVVCETGDFATRYMGILDKEYDKTTKNPNSYTFEKATAGAYLGPLTHFIIKQAIRDKVLSFEKSDEMFALPTLQTRDVNEFMHDPLTGKGPIGGLFGHDERDALTSFVYLTSIITKRAGIFAGTAIAASIDRISSGYDPMVPVRVAVEGTTYVIYKGLRETLESNLHMLLNANGPRSYVISPVEQASLFGAAVAALSR
ncbi:MAG: hexokinase [Treponema sp.]|jgi:hexokinase|nr:hexokinase [Treponema sp.]